MQVDPGHAVYYWLELEGTRQPRYYYEPWSEEARKRAEEIQQGMRDGSEMELRLPFEDSLETEKKAHPIPQPKLPEKPAPEPAPEFRI